MRPLLRIDRRRFTAGAASLPVACGLSRSLGGAFAAGSDHIRVGIVGCGGRGTGAALDAIAADAGVRVVGLADAFADQIESSVALLATRGGTAFDCPPERRFAGLDGWRRLLECDLDLVILATPPCFRPPQALAVVRTGRHVWCETPGAVDADGVDLLAAAAAEAADRGLSFASGLARRHDPASRSLVARLQAAEPLSALVHADLGLPWFKPARPGWSGEEFALRNWVAHRRFSGGDFVERHVAAIDAALWLMGDRDPESVEPLGSTGGVRYRWADGRHVDAALRRHATARGTIVESARCADGIHDFRRPPAAPNGELHPLAVAMAACMAAIRSGRRFDHGSWLCRATRAAVAGRMALDTGATVPWSDVGEQVASPARPLQSAHS